MRRTACKPLAYVPGVHTSLPRGDEAPGDDLVCKQPPKRHPTSIVSPPRNPSKMIASILRGYPRSLGIG